jgi:PAS domain-containing protein
VRGHANYRDFISRCPDGVWCLELSRPISVTLSPSDAADLIVRTGRVAHANDAAAALLGRNRGYELIGHRLPGLLVQEPGCLRKVLTDFIANDYRLADRSLSPGAPSDDRALVHSLTGIVESGALVRIWGVQRQSESRQAIPRQLQHVQKMGGHRSDCRERGARLQQPADGHHGLRRNGQRHAGAR